MSSCRTVDFKNEEVKRCLMKVQLDLLKLFQSLSNHSVGQNFHVFYSRVIVWKTEGIYDTMTHLWHLVTFIYTYTYIYLITFMTLMTHLWHLWNIYDTYILQLGSKQIPFNCHETVSWATVELSKQLYAIFVFWDLVWMLTKTTVCWKFSHFFKFAYVPHEIHAAHAFLTVCGFL